LLCAGEHAVKSRGRGEASRTRVRLLVAIAVDEQIHRASEAEGKAVDLEKNGKCSGSSTPVERRSVGEASIGPTAVGVPALFSIWLDW
jgi:hypothetical protein